MLHLRRDSGEFKDRYFREFPDLLRPDDLLVLNSTRVIPARLLGRRSGERAHPIGDRNPAAPEFLAGRVEALLTRQIAPNEWQALVKPGRKIGMGEKLTFTSTDGSLALHAEVVSRGAFGERTLRFAPVEDFAGALEKIGHVPLPPYIDRMDTSEDRSRYQTIYAKDAGSSAAPTAGLHFTPEILQQIAARGIEIAEITLHVGLGTFQPVRHERVEDNRLHKEDYQVSAATAERINSAKASGRRIVAVGTTTVRTLEYIARENGCKLVPGRGEADIFIYPGFEFRLVGAMLTNFHLPQSTLLMLVSAFARRDRVLCAYAHAVNERYRFFSYGDCMFVE